MPRYKQAKEHHRAEFASTLPMILAQRWFESHQAELTKAIESIDIDEALRWTKGSIGLEILCEYVIYTRTSAPLDVYQELLQSDIGRYLHRMLRGSGIGRPTEIAEFKIDAHLAPTISWRNSPRW